MTAEVDYRFVDLRWLVSSSDLPQGGKRSDLRMGDKGKQAAAKADATI